MTPFTKFELQIYTRGAWKIDSIYDDREIALFEAKKVQHGGHYLAVRVVEERASALNGETGTKIIFRATKANDGVGPGARAQKSARQEAQLALRAMRAGNGQDEAYADYGEVEVESCAGAVMMVLGLGGILLAGIAAIFALRYYFGAM